MTTLFTTTRRLALRAAPLLAFAALAACSEGSTEPSAVAEPTVDAVFEAFGEGNASTGFIDRAPEGLRLTDEQKAAISALREAFREANAADLEALRAIVKEAMEARRDGASREAIRAILEQGRPIHERLRPAFQQLRADIAALLTEAQRNWLAQNHRRHGPGLPPFGPPPGNG